MNSRYMATILGLLLISAAAVFAVILLENQSQQPDTRPRLNLTLEIYGNANMDSSIDQEDIKYLNDIIAGKANPTSFADANGDGIIDSRDIDQVRAIMGGNASFMLMLDGNREAINLTLPKNRILVEYLQNAELVRILKLEDKVVAVDYAVWQFRDVYFPGRENSIVHIGNMYTPDYELVLSVSPDIVLTFSQNTAEKKSKLPGVDVVYLGLYYPNVTDPLSSDFMQGILKAGYIFNRVNEATEYANWILNLTRMIESRTGNLTEAQKKSVLITNYPYTWSTSVKAYAAKDTLGQICILAGGTNVARDLSGYDTSLSKTVDFEWIINKDPEYIFMHTVRYTYSGIMYADPAHGYDVNSTASIAGCLGNWTSASEFANLTAVRNGHVYIIAGDFRNNAMGGTLGAVYVAKILYPDLFTDLDPEKIHQEYVTRFLRLNIDLNNQGVFLYPPIKIGNNTAGVPETP